MGQVNAVDTGFNNQYQAYLNRPMNIDTLGGENTQPIDFGGENTQPVNFQANQTNVENEENADKKSDENNNQDIGPGGVIWNIIKGGAKAVGSFFGFDGDGEWHFENFAKNAGLLFMGAVAFEACSTIAVACAGATGIMAVVGAVATALPVIAAGAFIAYALYHVGKGVVNAMSADTREEKENACQEIGAGIVETGLAVYGAKQLAGGKGISAKEAVKETYTEAWNGVKNIGEAAKPGYDYVTNKNISWSDKAKFVGRNIKEGYTGTKTEFRKFRNELKYNQIEKEITKLDSEIAEIDGQLANLKNSGTTNYTEIAELEARRDLLLQKSIGYDKINQMETYSEAESAVNRTEMDLTNAKAKLDKANNPKEFANAQYKVKLTEERLAAEKDALARRKLQAQAIENKMAALEKKKSDYADSKTKWGKSKSRKAEARQDELKEYAENAMEIPKNTSDNVFGKIGEHYAGRYARVKNDVIETYKAANADPQTKWLTINSAMSGYEATTASKMMGRLTPEEQKYVASLPKEQREALFERYKQLYVA